MTIVPNDPKERTRPMISSEIPDSLRYMLKSKLKAENPMLARKLPRRKNQALARKAHTAPKYSVNPFLNFVKSQTID